MSKFRQMLFIFLVFTLFISSCTRERITQVASMECLKSFQEFAYSGPDLNQHVELKKIMPFQPWQIEAQVPSQQVEKYFISSIETEITRSIGGHQEIWVTKHLFATDSGYSNKILFAVYRPKSQKWETVSADIGDSGLYVEDLFVTSDGSVWGKTVWDTIRVRPNLETAPVLSKFNEDTQRFEFAKGALEIPWVKDDSTYFPWPEIVLDNNGAFWFFAKNDGIYRYDPAMQKTEKQADFSGLNVTQASLSPDGSIYFEIYSEKIYSKESFFRLSDGMLFQFIPKTKDVIPLDIPDESWPVFSGMLVGHDNRLWLGAIGYRELDDGWHFIHPNPEQYFVSAGDDYMAPPSLMLESSDGVLWYRKFMDLDLRAEGTAWYDPQTEQGCMFTNIAANIVEDSKQQLWLVADGTLYKYPLNP